jgi:uncharacterized protein YvpB
MPTPYDGQILLVNWLGRNTPGATIADTAALLRRKMPNVSGIMLKTSNGLSWQGHLGDDDPKAVTGVLRIGEWVEAFSQVGLEVHVWSVPRAKNRVSPPELSPDLDSEAEKMARAALVPGVRSLLLDVEMGHLYWQGGPAEAQGLMERLRDQLGPDRHIALILDGRRNRDFAWWVDPWIPYVDSLHPMVYPILFNPSVPIENHLNEAFNNLAPYGKPIVPMLQLAVEFTRRPTAEEIVRQGTSSWARGAAGISFFRLGSDPWSGDGQPQTGDPQYAAVAQIPAASTPDGQIVIPPPQYTWQDIINASVTVAGRHQADWVQWWSDAGLWTGWHDSLRQQPYAGPPISGWPLDPAIRQEIIALVGLSSADLAAITAAARDAREREEREAAARLRRRRGSIVGIHGAPGVAAPPAAAWDTWLNYLLEMGIRWYKQCDNGDPNDLGPNSIFAWVLRLKQAGIEPIIRYLVSEQFPDPLPEHFFQKMSRYAQEGVVWAEIGNEPNLDIEWKSHWRNTPNHSPMNFRNPDVIRIIAETWIRDARKALDAGVRPAFYAFGPTDWRGNFHHLYSSVFFTRNVVEYLARHHRAETANVFNRGGWIAVHAATYEQPVAFDPHRPDGSIWDMTLRSYEVVIEAFREWFGQDLNLNDVVVMSTEGGVFTPNSTSMTGHDRLATDAEHAQRVVEMYQWLERHSPLQAMCPWCLSVGGQIGHFNSHFQFDGWIEEVNGVLRPRQVYEGLRQLRFDHEREAEQEDPGRQIKRLDVPYISQWDQTAQTHSADCGPTAMAMILNAGRQPDEHVTVDELYQRHLPGKPVGAFTLWPEMVAIGRNEGLQTQNEFFADGPAAMAALEDRIDSGRPLVVLVNYGKWNDIEEIARNNFSGAHFVVVVGYDADHIFIHDPLFRFPNREKGSYYVLRRQRFLDGWGAALDTGNPNFGAVLVGKVVNHLPHSG